MKSSPCGYNDTYILVKETIVVVGQGADAVATAADKIEEEVIFKNFATFTNCINKLYNKQADNVKDLDVVMSMYKLIEHINNYSKTSRNFWQYCRDKPDNNIHSNLNQDS